MVECQFLAAVPAAPLPEFKDDAAVSVLSVPRCIENTATTVR